MNSDSWTKARYWTLPACHSESRNDVGGIGTDLCNSNKRCNSRRMVVRYFSLNRGCSCVHEFLTLRISEMSLRSFCFQVSGPDVTFPRQSPSPSINRPYRATCPASSDPNHVGDPRSLVEMIMRSRPHFLI